ncbi:MAG: hypothetical protein GQ574_19830 [Crocinitomix sp.]|nr:hypothetical protein [Crocinitomix sp.]
MISGEDIAQYISNPNAIKQEDLSAFADLVKKYPYASSLHLLELKGLALANSIDFETKLKRTAIHAPDRGHLYALIHSGEQETASDIATEVANKENDVQEIIVAETPVEAITQNIEEIKETAVAELHETPPELNVVASENETQITDAEPLEKLTTTTETVIAEDTQTNADLPELSTTSELDVDILNKAIDVAFVSSEIENIEPLEKEAIIIPSEAPAEIPIVEDVIVTPALAETVAIPELTDVEQGDLTFIQWLRLKQAHKAQEIESAKKKATNEAPVATPKTVAISEELAEKTAPKADTRKKDIDSLLDKFMQEEPRISKPVRDFYSPVKNARKSVEESDDMVTETLAKIHVLQKNYSKAISAYEKLMLLYPEKKTFFASRIEKIREESKKR